jgi:hypothetical protein
MYEKLLYIKQESVKFSLFLFLCIIQVYNISILQRLAAVVFLLGRPCLPILSYTHITTHTLPGQSR